MANEPGDIYEREADQVAGQLSEAPVHHAASSVPPRIQRLAGQPTGHLGAMVSAGVNEALASPGRPLDPALRQDMEKRFGYDFSRVRVHSGAAAERSAADVNANAYTVGHDIVFGAGLFRPGTRAGRQLLTHELTHVAQQSGLDETRVDNSGEDLGVSHLPQPVSPALYRQPAAPPTGIEEQLEKAAEAIVTAKLGALAAKPGPAATFSLPGCPANFCQPFSSKAAAALDLLWAGPLILAGIARKVNAKVVPLWASYLAGGASPRSLTAGFGADFTASSTTAKTTDFLVGELRKDVQANHAALMGGAATATIDFTPRLSTALTAITTPGDPNEMNFDVIGDIAGNVAGGIGTDQLAFPLGAKPSPFNDDRRAKVTATLARNPSGAVTVTPTIDFSLHDTVDLCPGNCGAPAEQVATIPLSRFEATGLVGDVPFTIDFPAPSANLSPFVVSPPAPMPSPAPGVVTASALRIRAAPTTASATLGSYPRGAAITILCETVGETIDGNSTWDQTDKGFVSDRYVSRSGPAAPPKC